MLLSSCTKGTEPPTSGTIFNTNIDPANRIPNLKDSAELFIVQEIESANYHVSNTYEKPFSLGWTEYVGSYIYDRNSEISNKSVFMVFQVSVSDSGADKVVTKQFYMIQILLFYGADMNLKDNWSHEKPEEIVFPSYTFDGFSSLDSVIAYIQKDTGEESITLSP